MLLKVTTYQAVCLEPRECLSHVRGLLFFHRQDEQMGTQGSGKKKRGKWVRVKEKGKLSSSDSHFNDHPKTWTCFIV